MYFLKYRGVNKDCLKKTETLDIIKKLILPQLTYASEVICPSQSTIDHVNWFIASMICEMTCIPKNCPPMSVIWKANVEFFETILAKAKLRFYFKLINSKTTSTHKYLVEGELQSILKKSKSEHLTPQYIKQQIEEKTFTK